jgi:hypothetical protein
MDDRQPRKGALNSRCEAGRRRTNARGHRWCGRVGRTRRWRCFRPGSREAGRDHEHGGRLLAVHDDLDLDCAYLPVAEHMTTEGVMDYVRHGGQMSFLARPGQLSRR